MLIQIELPKTERKDSDSPQLNDLYNGFQRIELVRGCKRGCAFCYADPNMKLFEVPEITNNKVLILGEGILYDPNIKEKLIELGNKKVNGKCVYYGLSQGIDFRLLTREIAEILVRGRFGRLTKRGKWVKGIKFAWDGNESFETLAKETIDILTDVGYKREHIQVFVLVNWKISFETCMYKFRKLKEWGVQIDDCTWNSTKEECLRQINSDKWDNQFWKAHEYYYFRHMCRKLNQITPRKGYDPEAKA